MRFSKIASSLVTIALMGTSSMAELTKATRRDPSLAIRGADEDRLDQACVNGGLAKRDGILLPRTFVDMGADQSGPAGTTWETDGLATCLGVAVTGEYEDEETQGDSVFMAHCSPGNQGAIDSLVEKVKAAKDKGLKDLKATVVYVDVDSFPEEMAALGDAQSALNDNVIKKINDIGDVDVSEEDHSWEETGMLAITSDKSINYSTKDIGT